MTKTSNKWDWILWTFTIIIYSISSIIFIEHILNLKAPAISHWQYWLFYFALVFITRFLIDKVKKEVVDNYKLNNLKVSIK
jgi:hypothetical protein